MDIIFSEKINPIKLIIIPSDNPSNIINVKFSLASLS